MIGTVQVIACLLVLMEVAVSQSTLNQTPVRKKVAPAISEKLLCGSAPDTNASSTRPNTNSFCRSTQAPIYPAEAKEQGVQGAVHLDIVVGTDGTVKEVQVLEGHPLLAPAAVNAVKTWKYKPYYVNKKPTEMETTVIVNFTLEGKKASD